MDVSDARELTFLSYFDSVAIHSTQDRQVLRSSVSGLTAIH